MIELVNSARSYRLIEDAVMNFPSEDDCLEGVGVEAIEVDPGLALCQYIMRSRNSDL